VRYAWLVLAIFAGRFFSGAALFPEGDGDLAWQRWLGLMIRTTGRLPHVIGRETYTAPGAAWVPQEWLFSLIASLSYGAGWYLFAAVVALCATAALAIGALRALRMGATPVALAVVLLFAGCALCESFGVRAQVFALPLLALFLYFIEVDSRSAFWALAVAVVWSNVHASVMLAGPLALTAAAGSFLDERMSSRTKRTLVIGVGSLIATCCNPLGTDLPRYAVTLFLSSAKQMIIEWQRTDFSDPSFTFGALPLLLCLAALGIRGTTRWRDRSLVIVPSILMFTAVRNVPIFAIVCFPIVIRSLCTEIQVFAKNERLRETTADVYVTRLIPVAALALGIVVANALLAQARIEAGSGDRLAPALAAVRALPGKHRVLCADFAWCSFLIGSSDDRIFIDGRGDPYPVAVWNDFETIVRVRSGWDTKLRLSGTDVVVVAVTSSLEVVLALSHEWLSVYRNDTYRVWTRIPTVVLKTDECSGGRAVGCRRLDLLPTK
jgi:hypothetical protein